MSQGSMRKVLTFMVVIHCCARVLWWLCCCQHLSASPLCNADDSSREAWKPQANTANDAVCKNGLRRYADGIQLPMPTRYVVCPLAAQNVSSMEWCIYWHWCQWAWFTGFAARGWFPDQSIVSSTINAAMIQAPGVSTPKVSILVYVAQSMHIQVPHLRIL